MVTTKADILTALRAFVAQRAGMDPRNYGSFADYRQEARSVTRDRHDAERLIREIELRDSITAEMLIQGFKFSGRLTLRVDGTLEYCTGQYFPTEYRRAAAAVCASVLWQWTREHAMPKPNQVNGQEYYLEASTRSSISAGDWLRRHFAREFGSRLGKRYFD